MEDLGIWTLIVLIGGAVSIGGAIIRGLKGVNSYQQDRGHSATVLDAHGLDVSTLERFNPNLLGAIIPIKSSDPQNAAPLESVAVLYLLGDSPESHLKADLTLGTKGLTIVPHGHYERLLAYGSLENVSDIEPAGASDVVIRLTNDASTRWSSSTDYSATSGSEHGKGWRRHRSGELNEQSRQARPLPIRFSLTRKAQCPRGAR